eukprot:TRINITY_DN30277_c0_g1_i1.p1 TRINITY_DN30277_c0_g1~~TRINITY_DN30277_c0_g1_i1.p1  ORF type:complete len:293 (-),score=55.67 TRINITY_DN30277_c0_g1_i1:423-1301(-)
MAQVVALRLPGLHSLEVCRSASSLRSSTLAPRVALRKISGASQTALRLNLSKKALSAQCKQHQVDESVEASSDDSFDRSGFWEKSLLMTAAAMTPLLLDGEPALAVGGALGPLEGRAVALIHPIVMGSLFVFTLWAGYLGYQWRRVRTIGDEISALKKQIPAATEGAPESPLTAEVTKLTEVRKELVKGGFRDRHFNAGSILLGTGVAISVAGAINTWTRTGKLFPGPHLFAGAAITVLWALAAALVPAMQKGDENARSAHIALNTINVLLFVWQIPTGLEIVEKVFNLAWF